MLKRIIVLLTVAALMTAMVATSTVPAAAMERDEILEKIREITADRLGVDEGDVTPEAFEGSAEDREGFWESWAEELNWL